MQQVGSEPNPDPQKDRATAVRNMSNALKSFKNSLMAVMLERPGAPAAREEACHAIMLHVAAYTAYLDVSGRRGKHKDAYV